MADKLLAHTHDPPLMLFPCEEIQARLVKLLRRLAFTTTHTHPTVGMNKGKKATTHPSPTLFPWACSFEKTRTKD